MADNSRLEDLRRRVQKDPASIAFAQLAEEYRRAGQLQDAVDVCRAGLAIHPAYLSARVTLGRALIELNRLDDAQTELEQVLKSAPENLAAIRGLAEIHHRRGSLVEALAQYRAALMLARNDPDLEQTVNDLSRKLEPPKPAHADGLSFEQAQHELTLHVPVPEAAPAPPAPVPPVRETCASETVDKAVEAPVVGEVVPPAHAGAPQDRVEKVEASTPKPTAPLAAILQAIPPSKPTPAIPPPKPVAALLSEPAAPRLLSPGPLSADPARTRAILTVAALEQWLEALDVARAERRA